MRPITYFLSLGSNQGDRRSYLAQAIECLKNLGDITAVSSLYQTAPMSMPPGSDYFYNMVLCLRSSRTPRHLLADLKEIESRLGRNLAHSHNQPRTIDIDILLADQLLIRTATLSIPHPEMTKRPFVLVPLGEIAGNMIHPLAKKSIREILSRLDPIEGVKKIEWFTGVEKKNDGQTK